MKLIRDIDRLPESFRGGAISIGNFDGVHRGHARIIERLVTVARRIGGSALVFTFDPHPASILRPQQPPVPLCWTERKAELLGELGVDAVLAYPTTPAFLQLEARRFFDELVRKRLAARSMVEGHNFFFGHNRGGNVDLLGRFCEQAQIGLEVVDPLFLGSQPISSSRVRVMIARGQIQEANAMLTEPYRIRGKVIRGMGRGRTIGYPTANLAGIDTLLPGEGIYAGLAHMGPALHPAAISIGANPTFNEGALKIEVFVLDYDGDLYDSTLEVDFLAHLREIRKFASAEELVTQMARDVETARRIAAEELAS